ncbi:NAD(P)H-dependent oxidoreductase [Proteus myxofaciens]|uniref:Modulator of drug activity B n=1 Tax=Proteus myxofaciens ATCC 19692 TaxID=1354337 RepID=A0A198GK94_9GAMM|nr:NAD(P)H-dependent oxidoreductase [Proteus myxofaciens]OAT36616.1 modulator of drug activity B [Proteus myxofaciens ATCC 19692]
MTNVYIVNASKVFGGSEGKLNDHLTDVATSFLSSHQVNVKSIRIDDGYNNEDEVENFMWADVIIYQMPAWWMEGPWILKKYVDDVFSAGHERMFLDDGRTRKDPSKKYGSGGLLQGKKYLLSVTWNAPFESFEEQNQFFEGKGIDAVYFPFHKANQFLGMTPLKTFGCFDVVKQPQIEKDVEAYKVHLEQEIVNGK